MPEKKKLMPRISPPLNPRDLGFNPDGSAILPRRPSTPRPGEVLKPTSAGKILGPLDPWGVSPMGSQVQSPWVRHRPPLPAPLTSGGSRIQPPRENHWPNSPPLALLKQAYRIVLEILDFRIVRFFFSVLPDNPVLACQARKRRDLGQAGPAPAARKPAPAARSQ